MNLCNQGVNGYSQPKMEGWVSMSWILLSLRKKEGSRSVIWTHCDVHLPLVILLVEIMFSRIHYVGALSSVLQVFLNICTDRTKIMVTQFLEEAVLKISESPLGSFFPFLKNYVCIWNEQDRLTVQFYKI